MRNSYQNDEEFEEEKLLKKPVKSNKADKINAELQKIQNSRTVKFSEEKNSEKTENEEEIPTGAKILKNFFKKPDYSDDNETEFEIEEDFTKKPSKKAILIRPEKHIPLVDSSGNKISRKENPAENEIQKTESKSLKKSAPLRSWKFPSLELLRRPKKGNPISSAEIREKALIIQKTLLQFGIEVDMEAECVGPTVIQYRLRPAE